jgi:hypothetical protein
MTEIRTEAKQRTTPPRSADELRQVRPDYRKGVAGLPGSSGRRPASPLKN